MFSFLFRRDESSSTMERYNSRARRVYCREKKIGRESGGNPRQTNESEISGKQERY